MLALLLVFVLAACTAPTGPNQAANPQQPAPGQPAPGNVAVDPRTTGDAPTDPARSLTIVAGSEQQSVLANVVLPWCRDRGYSCSWSLLGSVDQTRLLQSGSFDNDAFWFASSVFSQMGNTNGNLRDAEPMFLTPIVFAAKPEVLTRLGLTGDATAQQVMDATESGKARVWATNPTQSNSARPCCSASSTSWPATRPGRPSPWSSSPRRRSSTACSASSARSTRPRPRRAR